MPTPEPKQLKATRKEYDRRVSRWKRARTVYESDITKLRNPAYLEQRAQGEHKVAYQERKSLADFTPLFAALVNVYAGRLMQAEPKVERSWEDEEGSGLGQVGDPDTLAGKIAEDVDGRGMNYLTMLHHAAVKLVSMHELWCIVEGVKRDEDGNEILHPTIRLINPDAVYDWEVGRFGTLKWAKVHHQVTVRDDWTGDPTKRDRWTIYEQQGFTTYEIRENKKGDPEVFDVTYEDEREGPKPYGPNGFQYQRSADQPRPILPIFRVRLPMLQFVGSILAEKNVVLFNQESERDNILRVANMPSLKFAGTEEEFKDYAERVRNGKVGNVLFANIDHEGSESHEYLAPSSDPAKVASEVLKDKRKSFFLSGFQFYEDATRGSEKTATQVAQESAPEQAFLNTLATALDELELGIGKRLEQIEFPNDSEQWGQFSIERPADFDPMDAEKEADELMQRLFGRTGKVALTEEAEIEATKRFYEANGLPVDEEAITEEVRNRRDASNRAADFEQAIG